MSENVAEDLNLSIEEPKSSNKKMIIIAVLAVVLIGGGLSAYFLMSSGGGSAGEAENAEPVVEPLAEPQYFAFGKPFVVNFQGEGKPRFAQIEISIMARDSEALSAIETHMPLLRNDLLLLFSGQTHEQLSSMDGKEELRAKALNIINDNLKEQSVKASIETVLFTKFIIQ